MIHYEAELDFEHLLTAHGDPAVGGARQTLHRFAETDERGRQTG